jgi:hypothetical protein
MPTPIRQRVSRNDCIESAGRAHSRGYRSVQVDGVSFLAHRVAYEAAYGPIPTELPSDGSARWEVHHRCENKVCVNPEHLQLVTSCEHKRIHLRGRACKRGHEFTTENTYVQPSTGRYACRTCKLAATTRWNHARSAERAAA